MKPPAKDSILTALLERYWKLTLIEVIGKTPGITAEVDELETAIRARKQTLATA